MTASSSPQNKQSRQEAIEGSLRIVTGMLKCSSSQLMASGMGKRPQLSLRRWPLGVWPCSNENMGTTNWTWYTCVFLFSFGGEDTKVVEWIREERESSVNGWIVYSSQTINKKYHVGKKDLYYEFMNSQDLIRWKLIITSVTPRKRFLYEKYHGNWSCRSFQNPMLSPEQCCLNKKKNVHLWW